MGQLAIVLAMNASVAGQDRPTATPSTRSLDETSAVRSDINLLDKPVLPRMRKAHTSIVSAAWLSPDGKTLVTGSADKTARPCGTPVEALPFH